MELFIDLSEVAEPQVTKASQVTTGVDLNLSGLVSPKQEQSVLPVSQTDLETEAELNSDLEQIALLRNFIGTLSTITTVPVETAKVLEKTVSNTTKETVSKLIDPVNKLTQNLTEKDQANLTTTDAPATDSDTTEAGLNVASSKMLQISDIQSELDTFSRLSALLDESEPPQENLPAPLEQATNNQLPINQTTLANTATNSLDVISKQLVNAQETQINQQAQTNSALLDTVSNFSNTTINQQSSQNQTVAQGAELTDPVKGELKIVSELAKPDLSSQTLSAIQKMADNTQTLTDATTTINSVSQVNNTGEIASGQFATAQSNQMASPEGQATIINNQSPDNSAVYLMQMLNLMKSGQIKVKLT
jgi:hypothetical protein